MDRSDYRLPGYLLGFALGGFFDGILLHQILQWHHLLSAIDPEDIRFQIAADGYFHAFMYVVAAVGLWRLWATGRASAPLPGRRLSAAMLIGFGAWHILDAVLSHWLLGIHRIRMDSDVPLLWDLAWLALFGLMPVLWGLLLGRPPRDPRPAGPARGVARPLAAILVMGAGWQALQPVWDDGFATVLFAPGTGTRQVAQAVVAVDGALVWTDRSGDVAVIRVGEGHRGWSLFRHGAILVGGAGLPPGCLSYART